MNDIGSARFITKLQLVGRELDILREQRQERHDEFRRRLTEIRERCERLTVHRLDRLKTEGIIIGMSEIRIGSRNIAAPMDRSETTLNEHESMKPNTRARSSELCRPYSPPKLQMEMSFHCREVPQHTPRSGTENQHDPLHLTGNKRHIEGMITASFLENTKHVSEWLSANSDRDAITDSANNDTISVHGFSAAKRTSNTNLFKPIDVQTGNYKLETNDTVRGAKARHNFRRLSNKLTHTMQLNHMNQRRHTMASSTPVELRPRPVELYTQPPVFEDDKRYLRHGFITKRQHVLNRTERQARVRMYSEGSESVATEAKKKLRRAFITIQSVRQLVRKQLKLQ